MEEWNDKDLSPALRMSNKLPSEKVLEPWQFGGVDQTGEYTAPTDRTLQYYFGIASKRRKLIIAVSVLIIGTVTAYSFLATRLYTATANIKIGTYAPALPGDESESMMRATTLEQDYLNTQVNQLRSLSLADQVLSDPEAGPEIRRYLTEHNPALAKATVPTGDSAYHHPLKLLESYLGQIEVEPVFKTSIVKLSATTASPVMSAKLANVHGRAFIELTRNERQKAALDNLMFLKSQAAELEGRVADAERGLAVYAEQNSIITLESNESLVVRQMAELNRLLTEATSRRVKSEAELKEAKNGAGLNSSVLDDESIRTLRTQLKEAEAEYAMLSQKFQPSYPKMQQLKARVDDLRRGLNSERKGAVAALDAQYNSDLGAEKELRSQMEKLKESAFDLSRKLVQYNIMKREYESLKDLHQTVLRQLKEAQMSSENRNSNIIISDMAAIPDFPSRPARKVNMMLAMAFGPLLGFMLALLLENMERSIKDPDDVSEYLGLPSLGVVPVFDGRSGAVGSAVRKPLELIYKRSQDGGGALPPAPVTPADTGVVPAENGKADLAKHFVTIRSPRSIAAEAFQTIRTGLLLSSAERPPQVVLVTSAKKHEGKTTLVSNLGITLAQASSRTILIDCDLRRPSLHRRFGIDQTAPGLVDYLTGRRSLEEVMVPTQVKNLTVLPAGTASPNPAALIGSRRMVELLKILSERYEYVLLDSPPILPVADALMLSSMGAGVILVVHGKQSDRRQVQEAARRLRQARAGILGVVVNQSSVRDKDYYDVYGDIESFEVVQPSSSEAINA